MRNSFFGAEINRPAKSGEGKSIALKQKGRERERAREKGGKKGSKRENGRRV